MLPRKMPPKTARYKVGDYSLNQKFIGYNARQDKTTQTPNVLVAPSQNVVLGTSGRVALVKGYALDGATSVVIDSGILSNYDFDNFKGDRRNMRAGFLTSAGNDGKLQYRYVNSAGTISWVNLMTSLTSIRMSFCDYWDNTALIKYVLWVDGSSNVYSWNGAVTTFASATSNTITKQGTNTWQQEGFTGAGSITIGGVTATYTGGYGTTTLTGVSHDFSGTVVASEIHQTPVTTALSSFNVINNLNFLGNNALLTAYVNPTGTSSFTPNNNNLVGASLIATNAFSTNPTDTQTFILNINGSPITFTFVAAIGVTAGNVLIETTLSATLANLQDLITNPSSTTAKHVALSGPNQTLVGYLTASVIGGLSAFYPTVIGCGRRNQVYLGSSSSNNLFISRVNNYLDYSFTSPTRIVGEGALIPLDAFPVGFLPMEVVISSGGTSAYDMYISEGLNTWSIIRSTLSSDNTKEQLEHIRMKVAPLEGAKSGRFMGKMTNHIMFIGNDNVAKLFGYLSYENVPSTTDFSYPIIDDMNSYDFTDGSLFYHRNYIYVSVPKSGLIRIYNMTDQTAQQNSNLKGVEDITQQPWFWEAPVTYPISGFYVVAGELYGHSYTTSESYKLFTGGNFNHQDIDANATFAFDDKGDRTQSKASDEIFVEGYIKQNTELNVTVNGDLDSFQTSQTRIIDGSDNTIVAYGAGAHSLGKNPLGSQPLGGAQTVTSTLPAWFHCVKTYPEVPFYLEQISFESKGVDLQWELTSFGTNAEFTPEGNNSITE